MCETWVGPVPTKPTGVLPGETTGIACRSDALGEEGESLAQLGLHRVDLGTQMNARRGDRRPEDRRLQGSTKISVGRNAGPSS